MVLYAAHLSGRSRREACTPPLSPIWGISRDSSQPLPLVAAPLPEKGRASDRQAVIAPEPETASPPKPIYRNTSIGGLERCTRKSMVVSNRVPATANTASVKTARNLLVRGVGRDSVVAGVRETPQSGLLADSRGSSPFSDRTTMRRDSKLKSNDAPLGALCRGRHPHRSALPSARDWHGRPGRLQADDRQIRLCTGRRNPG